MATEKMASDRQNRVFPSACPYNCFDCCSLQVYVENGRVIKVSANAASVYTGNFLCKKGTAHVQRMYSTERLRRPLLKTAAGHVPVSWEKAFALLAGRIREAVRRYGPLAVGSYVGDGAAGVLKTTVQKVFLAHLGGYTELAGSLCWGAGLAATCLDMGDARSHHPSDLRHARVLVLWGRNVAETNIHLVPYIRQAKKSGCRVYLIDPRRTFTAGLADVHLQIRPGTDWALAAACLIRCLQDGLADENFIAHRLCDKTGIVAWLAGAGTEIYRALVTATGLAEEAVASFTRDIAAGGPASCYLGYGLQRYRHGGLTVRTVDLLWALTGNIGIAGGGINYANRINGKLFDFSFALPEKEPAVRRVRLGCLAQDLEAADPPLAVLLVSGANPASQLPDSKNTGQALARIPFTVCLDHFLTETAAACDLVLPVTYFTETEDIITSGMWNSGLNYAAHCSDPPGECMSEFAIFLELADRLNLHTYPRLPARDWLERCLAPAEAMGLSFARLQAFGHLDNPLQQEVAWAGGRFATPDGLFHALDRKELEAMLRTLQEQEQAAGTLNLLTVHWHGQIHSQHPAGSREGGLPLLYLHPEMARQFNVADGQEVVAATERACLKVKIAVTAAASPHAAHLRQGTGEPGRPVNLLTPPGLSDLGCQAVYNTARIRLLPQA
ncbi:MAG TPA: molybdopterin-dependent oxidoreductase [Firmicutes bacterium]|nr:molybdopterin-dependent oxidoreductase [Bacillota bacterium]